MGQANKSAEENGESGLWIIAKVALFVAIPALLFYIVKVFVS